MAMRPGAWWEAGRGTATARAKRGAYERAERRACWRGCVEGGGGRGKREGGVGRVVWIVGRGVWIVGVE
jgi:hypothetical protein